MASTITHQYFPLEYEDAIRVLQLFPSGDPEDPIRVELLPCRLTKGKLESSTVAQRSWTMPASRKKQYTQSRFKCNAEIQYEALSYTWGDPKDKDRPLIYISEHPTSSLPVTRNCFNALKALRQRVRPRNLWIDAICINQADLKERSHQVRNMARTYASASSTVIYLGEHTRSSYVVFQWAVEESACWENYDEDDQFGYPRFRKPPKAEVFQGVRELIQRPWFRRVWVLQEVISEPKVAYSSWGPHYSQSNSDRALAPGL